MGIARLKDQCAELEALLAERDEVIAKLMEDLRIARMDLLLARANVRQTQALCNHYKRRAETEDD